jgi:hypothetical protein
MVVMAALAAGRTSRWVMPVEQAVFPVAVAVGVERVLYQARLERAAPEAGAQYASRPISEG